MPNIRTLRIQLTEICNLGCLYCCHEGTKCDYNIIKDRNLVNLIKAAKQTLGIERVKFTGGEPLLHDGNILGIMRQLSDLHIKWSIVTNATNLTKMTDFLDNRDFDITVSLPVPINSSAKEYWDITRGDRNLSNKYFSNVRETINLAITNQIRIKINYVLCKNYNDSTDQIKEMVSFAQRNRNIDLRFLETVSNLTNNDNHRMDRFSVSKNEFLNKIRSLYPDCTIDDSQRSHSLITLTDGTIFRLVKFFCNDNCYECPSDKTSLWLTPTGELKDCSFRIQSQKINDWSLKELKKLLIEYKK